MLTIVIPHFSLPSLSFLCQSFLWKRWHPSIPLWRNTGIRDTSCTGQIYRTFQPLWRNDQSCFLGVLYKLFFWFAFGFLSRRCETFLVLTETTAMDWMTRTGCRVHHPRALSKQSNPHGILNLQHLDWILPSVCFGTIVLIGSNFAVQRFFQKGIVIISNNIWIKIIWIVTPNILQAEGCNVSYRYFI